MNGHDTLHRRQFLRASGATIAGMAASAALAACGSGSSPTVAGNPLASQPAQPPSAQSQATPVQSAASQPAAAALGKVVIRWWDHFQPLTPLHKKIWDTYTAGHANVQVDYTQYNPNEMAQALQLAFKSQQMPDVHSLGGISVPVPSLVKDNWFAPLNLSDDARKRLPEGSLLEGFSVFGGKVYSFPLFSFRQYTSLNWYNKDLFAKASIDPTTNLRTWDQFRQAAGAITKKGGGTAFGWIQGIGFVDRLGVHVNELAQTAGASTVGGPGPTGSDPKTGQYVYASDPYVQTLDFLASVQRDGSLFPASSTLDARTGRARWATGIAGMFLDGPWNIGVVQGSFKDFTDKVGVAPVPVPDTSKPAYIHVLPSGGQFFISSQSKHPDIAADILQQLTTPDYYIGLAQQMDQPPLDLTAVDKANVQPTYKQAIKLFQDGVRLGPSPVVKNAAVSDVFAEMKDIHPNLGEIAQGVFSGDVKDTRAALKEYNDKLTAERDRALKVVTGKGVKVSLADWVFANWQPDQDYTAASYK